MARSQRALAPHAHLTLRAHLPAPARIELAYRPPLIRLYRTLAWLILCWGSIPFLLWVPPHYPWITMAFLGGAYMAFRSWTGRYAIHSFAGICPRCGSALSLGRERTIDLPHTLTCFNCHFEPQLEVHFAPARHEARKSLEHQSPDCVGDWEIRWLADEQFLYCNMCHAGAPADEDLRRQAEQERETAQLLMRLADEGKPLI
jgi:hypothetical protein